MFDGIDGKAFGREIVDAVKGYLDKRLADIAYRLDDFDARLKGLEAFAAAPIEPVRAPIDQEQIDVAVARSVDVAFANVRLPEPVPGKDGKDGRDGVDAVDVLIDHDGVLVFTLGDGNVRRLARVVGRDGEPGGPGPKGEPGDPGTPGAQGRDGKDVDPAEVDMIIGKQLVAAVEDFAAQLGEMRDTTIADVRAAAQASFDGLEKGLVDGLASIAVRTDQAIVENVAKEFAKVHVPQDGDPGRDGRDGVDGKSVTIDDIRDTIREEVAQLPPAPSGEPGRDGRDGVDGKSISIEDVKDAIRVEVDIAVKSLPMPADGHTPTREELEPMIETIAKRLVAALPVPKDGAGMAGFLITREGEAVATMSDGRVEKLGTIVGRDGKDGRDGFEFDDMEIVYDGLRNFGIRFERGEHKKAWDFVLPVNIYRGIWKPEESYERGDTATFGGSLWIAERGAPSKPGDGDDSGWRLAVKAGRNGKDGTSVKGEKGDQGPAGRDMTRFMPESRG